MRDCHYITDKRGRQVLIPGCFAVAVHYDDAYPLDRCTCKSSKVRMVAKVMTDAERAERVAAMMRSIPDITPPAMLEPAKG